MGRCIVPRPFEPEPDNAGGGKRNDGKNHSAASAAFFFAFPRQFHLWGGSIMEIIVNGKPMEINASTIGDLLFKLGIDPTRVVVEHNQEIMPKEMQKLANLNNGDRIEIIHFVGGG
jgi:sulfur carrier protein